MITQLRDIAAGAGQAILKHYGTSDIQTKDDNSPLTLADLASHRFICDALRDLDPSIPVLSEESSKEEMEKRHEWQRFWLVDPLDGTKEFIKQTGQFTVNIALIDGHSPVIGVIHVPATGLTYWADKATGAFKCEADAEPVAIKAAEPNLEKLRIVASRDHAGPMVKELLERFPTAETRSMGSSLKFCLVAEGEADIYLRDVPTMEWDTGAAQCIVETAGGIVQTLEGEKLPYNKQDLRNPSLVTLGDPALKWR